jgi:hypothetical protein
MSAQAQTTATDINPSSIPKAGEGKSLDIPIPPAEHPRLLFRKKDLPELLEVVSKKF